MVLSNSNFQIEPLRNYLRTILTSYGHYQSKKFSKKVTIDGGKTTTWKKLQRWHADGLGMSKNVPFMPSGDYWQNIARTKKKKSVSL